MAAFELNKQLLEHFNVTECIRAKCGGQKSVYKVTIEDQQYALKIINIADERFEREVKICKEFSDHSGIPTIERIEQFEGDTIILEEYISGNDLSDVTHLYKGNSKKICKLIHSISIILQPVWEARYIHRDLKPANIRIKGNGDPIVLDFGIARALDEESITVTGGQPLTYLFASPEQYEGKKHLISYRTDFFCLGLIAYYLYTNEYPFGGNKVDIETSFTKNSLQRSTGNKAIDKFCNAVFKSNPSERPRNIDSFLNLIEL